jgi:hypothetical protein
MSPLPTSGNLRLSDAERRIMDAVQDKQAMAFLAALGLFAALSAARLRFRLSDLSPAASRDPLAPRRDHSLLGSLDE